MRKTSLILTTLAKLTNNSVSAEKIDKLAKRQVAEGDVEANPIIEAIYRKLNMSKKNKLSADHFLCMLPNLIYSVTDQIIQDKVYADLEASHSVLIMERCPVSFPTFMYDSMIMQYGIMNIAIKVLM